MPTGHTMMAMSLDGFVARKDHTLDWLMKLDTEGEEHGFADFQEGIDVIVMGTGSFRTVLSFGEWPYQKPVVVLSRTMREEDIPDHIKGKVEFSQLSPDELMSHLGERGISRVYVDGGAIIHSFLRAGHIADMRVAVAPVLIGDGIRMFGDLTKDIDLFLEEVSQFQSGLVQMRYRVI
ncbi:5-amino-6-(5-phosphoribosylamino)uracil reductase [Labrenzia sp. THAF82]|uniref:dihydrofolate reductase family protein n=1 Tax=Labrenzia sp. THAF82 TaxID=2587861 RepID=UPI001268D87C|nr:dihydrofolate reductase family protein [Labrenzia sp. THAF82]QFT34613.1 5-amino-6-(5-phosphoribosylamino)uracil reductase [Labrenzia sp. THAF82]